MEVTYNQLPDNSFSRFSAMKIEFYATIFIITCITLTACLITHPTRDKDSGRDKSKLALIAFMQTYQLNVKKGH